MPAGPHRSGTASANQAAGGGSFTDDHGAGRYTVVSLPAVNVSPLNCAGPNACDIVSVYTSIFWIAMAVLVIVGGLIVYAALRFRRTDDREPAQVHGNPRLEVLWTAIPVLIVSFVFFRTTLRMDYVRNRTAPLHAMQDTGIQWGWSFNDP